MNIPKGVDANAYALSITSASKSLGALLRAAERMAGAKNRPRMTMVSDDGENRIEEVAPTLGE